MKSQGSPGVGDSMTMAWPRESVPTFETAQTHDAEGVAGEGDVARA